MISDAQLQASMVDQGGRPSLAWGTWFVQLVAALNGLLNFFTAGKNNTVTVANPAGLSFGAWTSFAPAVNSASTSFATMNTGAYGSYLRVGQLVWIQIDATLNVLTPASIIYLNIPVLAAGMAFNPLTCSFNTPSAWGLIVAMTQGNLIPLLPQGGSFPAGTMRVIINGAYRVA